MYAQISVLEGRPKQAFCSLTVSLLPLPFLPLATCRVALEKGDQEDECNGSLMDRYINRTSHLPGCKPQARTARSSSAKSCFDHVRPTDSTLDVFELLHSVHAQRQCQSSIGGVPSRVSVLRHRDTLLPSLSGREGFGNRC
jgi:hypothetical protein